MNRLSLVPADDPILHQRAELITDFTEPGVRRTLDLVKEMFYVMRVSRGLGLAAPQVGVRERIFVVRTPTFSGVFLNPRITWKSDTVSRVAESCLSLPGVQVDVWRPLAIGLEWQDQYGFELRETVAGLPARVVQHEIDHLNGILITDYQTVETHE